MRACLLLALVLSLPPARGGETVHPITGRHIAPVMGYGGAPWLVRPEREQEEAPDAALDAIGFPRAPPWVTWAPE
ncbi:MAG TPA: hypothetical protein VFA33_00815 [Bryobacteraceae bacterium]|nr:hypothetical protein [Bryobacteraceae bacterium]